MFGLRMRMITEVTVHEPPAGLGWRQVGRFMTVAGEEGEYRPEPVDGGTRMTFRGSVSGAAPPAAASGRTADEGDLRPAIPTADAAESEGRASGTRRGVPKQGGPGEVVWS